MLTLANEATVIRVLSCGRHTVTTMTIALAPTTANQTALQPEKTLPSIKDRGQTDRVTALPRPYAPDIDL